MNDPEDPQPLDQSLPWAVSDGIHIFGRFATKREAEAYYLDVRGGVKGEGVVEDITPEAAWAKLDALPLSTRRKLTDDFGRPIYYGDGTRWPSAHLADPAKHPAIADDGGVAAAFGHYDSRTRAYGLDPRTGPIPTETDPRLFAKLAPRPDDARRAAEREAEAAARITTRFPGERRR